MPSLLLFKSWDYQIATCLRLLYKYHQTTKAGGRSRWYPSHQNHELIETGCFLFSVKIIRMTIVQQKDQIMIIKGSEPDCPVFALRAVQHVKSSQLLSWEEEAHFPQLWFCVQAVPEKNTKCPLVSWEAPHSTAAMPALLNCPLCWRQRTNGCPKSPTATETLRADPKAWRQSYPFSVEMHPQILWPPDAATHTFCIPDICTSLYINVLTIWKGIKLSAKILTYAQQCDGYGSDLWVCELA